MKPAGSSARGGYSVPISHASYAGVSDKFHGKEL